MAKYHEFTLNNGTPMLARLVEPGDRYGLNDCLKTETKLVEFYSLARAEPNVDRDYHGNRGFMVSRYYASTLTDPPRDQHQGLCLHGGMRLFDIDAENLQTALKALGLLTEE